MEITDEVKSKLYTIFRAKLNEICNRVLYSREQADYVGIPLLEDLVEEGGDGPADIDMEDVWNEYLKKQGIVCGNWKECLKNSGIVLGSGPSDSVDSVVIRDPLFPALRWIAVSEQLAMKIMVFGEVP